MEETHRLRLGAISEQHRSSKGRQEPYLTRKAEAIVVPLTEKVLERRVNSTPVSDVPAGGGQQLGKWIRVRKERERVGGGAGEGGREREREKGELQGFEFSSSPLLFGLATPCCNQDALPLAKSSGPASHPPPFPNEVPILRLGSRLAVREQLPAPPSHQ